MRSLNSARFVPLAAAAVALVVLSLRGGASSDDEAAAVRRRIAEHADLHWDFDVARDGRHVGFANLTGEAGLFVIDLGADGRTPVVDELPVTPPMPQRPRLSPDGRRVVFHSFGDGDAQRVLHLFDRETRRESILVGRDARGSYADDAAWSPGGDEVAFTRIWQDDAGWHTTLHVVRPADGATRTLETGPVRAPAWSPDGRHLAYVDGANLMVVAAAGGPPRLVRRFDGARPAPSIDRPDPPEWSPDGLRIAYAIEEADCHRIQVITVATGEITPMVDDCAMRPTWLDDRRIAYVRLGGSVRSSWMTDGTTTTRLGFASGLVYELGVSHAGDVIALGMPGDEPRGVWRFDPAAPGAGVPLVRSLDPPLPPEWISVAESATVTSADGLAVPIQTFPAACGEGLRPGILWIHGGPNEDIAPRWYQEIQYATSLGATVVAVNYRGSTGNGRAYRELDDDTPGQLADVTAALAYLRARPEVDPARVLVFHVSWGANLTYPLAARDRRLAGVIDWVGSPSWWREPAVLDLDYPPMLWISGARDRITHERRSAVRLLRARGVDVHHVELDADHAFTPRAPRARALEALAGFVEQRAGATCRR